MSSKKTTSTNQTQNTASTSTPNVPDWIANPTQQAAGNIANAQAMGPGQFTPGISDVQQQAYNQAQYLQGSSANYDTATNILKNIPGVTNGGGYQSIGGGGGVADITNGGVIDPVTGQSVLTNLDAYYNPFKSQILNPVLADYDYQSGQTRAAQAAAAAKGGAFGGSRYGIQEAQTEGDLARGRASTEGGLLNSMYTQAAGMSEADTARRQAADLANQQGQEFTAGQNLTASQANQQAALNEKARQFAADQANQSAGLTVAGRQQAAEEANQAAELQRAGLLSSVGTAQGADARANVALQNDIGSSMTSLQNVIKQYPLAFQQQISGLLQGLNPGLYTGQSSTGTGSSQGTSTETSNPGLLDYLKMGLQGASMFAGPIAGAMGGGASASPSWSAYGT